MMGQSGEDMTADAEVITTYLEMLAPQPLQTTPPHRSAGCCCGSANRPPAFYRYLDRRIGRGSREALDDEAIGARLLDDDYDVYVVYLGGVPAAMFELDRRTPSEIEVVGVRRAGRLPRQGPRQVRAGDRPIETGWQHGPEQAVGAGHQS